MGLDFKLIKKSLELFSKSFIRIGIWVIGLKILIGLCLVPLFFYIINSILKYRGIDFIGNWEMIYFFLNPIGILLIIISFLVLSIVLTFEIGGISLIYEDIINGQKTDYIKLIGKLFKFFLRVLKKGLFRFVGIFLILWGLLIVGLGILAAGLFYVITNIGNGLEIMDFVYLIGFLFLVGVFFWFLINWLFVFHIAYFDHQTIPQAMKTSQSFVKTDKKKSYYTMLLWTFIIVSVSLLVNISLNELLDYIIPNGYVSQNVLLFSSIIIVLQTILNFAFTVFMLPLILAFVSILHACLVTKQDLQTVKIISKSPYRLVYKIAFSIFLVIGISFGSYYVYFQIDHEIDAINNFFNNTAHRGNSGVAPQNTMAAVTKSIDDHADILEIDVQETKDGVVVLMHDESVKKVSGLNKKIWEIDYEQVKQLDVGSSFSAKYKGEKIPTLEQVLDETRGKIKVLIEIKEYGHGRQIVQKVSDLINTKCNPGDCLMHSLDKKILVEFRKINPNVKIGYILASGIGNFYTFDFDFFSISANMLTDDFITKANQHKKGLRIWTLNDKEQIDDVIALGVDGIISDFPLLVKENVEYWNNLSDSERLKIRLMKLMNN